MYLCIVVVLSFRCVAALDIGGANGQADAKSVVLHGPARFTVLTPRLIRIEAASSDGTFNDQPTYTVINRQLPTPKYLANTVGDTLTITTEYLTLTYRSVWADSTCGTTIMADVIDAERTSLHPNPIPNQTLDSCCGICQRDPQCTNYLWDPATFGHVSSPAPGDCWIISHHRGTKPAKDRRLGSLSAFNASSLWATIKVNESHNVTWHAGDISTGNLGGAISSWNEINPTNLHVQPGLLSRDGWALISDTSPRLRTTAPLFQDKWPWLDESNAHSGLDWYLLGHGRDYQAALADFARISGDIPLVPRSALGVWYSHYEAYTMQSFEQNALAGFLNFSLPLNRVNFDVNWHFNPTNKLCNGYNG